MQPKLQELTEKIYSEGIERGNEEAEKIISNAKKEADTIIKNARTESEKIIAQAQQKSADLQTKTESELKLSTRQAVNALKQQIAGTLISSSLKPGIKEAFNDSEYLKELILTVIKNWNPSGESQTELQLPASKEKEFKSFFEEHAKSLLNKGVKVNFNNRLTNGFEIGPSDNSYKISFTDEDFISFFNDYLRPKLSSMLFEGEK